MGQVSFKASAPGNLMLLGEHAVLHGRRALVCAVSKRIQVELTLRDDDLVVINSPRGEYEGSLKDLPPRAEFRFVLAAIGAEQEHLKSGFDLAIHSEFSSTVGLGSSAAVTAATCAVLAASTGHTLSPQQLHDHSVHVIQKVQGMGSGADVAASVFGGVVAYRMKPQAIRKLNALPPITVVYSGEKVPTADVVQKVEQARREQLKLFTAVFDAMDQSVLLAVEAIEKRNWSEFGSILNLNQGLMDAMGVNTRALSEITFALRETPGILGAKISGAGLGDCVIAIGSGSLGDLPYEVIPVDVSSEGVIVD